MQHIYKVTFVDEPGKKDYQVGDYIVDIYHVPETCEPHRTWVFPDKEAKGVWRLVAKYVGTYEKMQHLLPGKEKS